MRAVMGFSRFGEMVWIKNGGGKKGRKRGEKGAKVEGG
jgi:hypothetical protein